ncbi:MAG: hypothetical protein AB7R55_23030 [Gemmatimonadales bacterium]
MSVFELAFALPWLTSTIALLAVGDLLLAAAVPSMFAALHAVCGSARRAMSVAVVFFFANLIGAGLGPIVTGRLSDTFAPSVGSADGLRYAMMIVMMLFVPCGWFMLRAGRNLARDVEP